MEIYLDWTELRDESDARSIPLQYVTKSSPSEYIIWFDDGNTTYHTSVTKAGTAPNPSDQKDFEDNYKSGANVSHDRLATDRTPYVRVTEKTVGKTMQVKGFEITGAANTVTNHDIKWTEDIEIVGGFADAYTDPADSNTVFEFKGSKVQMQVVDVDNILGYGAGTVLNTFAVDIPATKLLLNGCAALSTTAFDLLTGLYIRIAVDNQHTTDKIYVAGSLKYYH